MEILCLRRDDHMPGRVVGVYKLHKVEEKLMWRLTPRPFKEYEGNLPTIYYPYKKSLKQGSQFEYDEEVYKKALEDFVVERTI